MDDVVTSSLEAWDTATRREARDAMRAPPRRVSRPFVRACAIARGLDVANMSRVSVCAVSRSRRVDSKQLSLQTREALKKT